jgi:hypothetical protein
MTGNVLPPPEITVEAKSPPSEVTVEAKPHPGGYKAESLMQLQPLIPPKAVSIEGLSDGEEPILTVGIITGAVIKLTEGVTNHGVILSFSHDHYATIAGGTQLCVGIEEREGAAEGYVYLHAHPRPYLQSLAPSNVEDLIFLRLTLNGVILGICSYATLQEAAKLLHENGKKQYVVIHHLLGHSVECVSNIIAATGQRRGWLWLHDFFTLCASPHLLRNGISFCSAPKVESAACGICSYGTARLTHLQQMRGLFESNKLSVIAPSNFVADLWRERSGLPFAGLSIVPHLELEWVSQPQQSSQSDERIRVAFIGQQSLSKGWPHFVKLVNELRDNENYEFIYFGVHEPNLGIRCCSVSVSNNNRTEMIEALRAVGIDVVLHISPTPETFSFTTHEAIASGAYVVTNSGSGNTACVIGETGRGLVLEHENDIYAAFAEGEIIRLGKQARARRMTEFSKVIFSQFTIPFLIAETD